MEAPTAMKDPVSNEPRWMPREAVQEGLVKLTDRQELIKESLDRALASDAHWPDTQFLWEIHPFATWLEEQMNRLFNRKEVPVTQLQESLELDESIFLFFGRIPNQGGSTLLDSWIGVHFRDRKFTGYMTIEEVLFKAQLEPESLVNVGIVQVAGLQSMVGNAVEQAQSRFHEQVAELNDEIETQTLEEDEKLVQLCDKHHKRIQRRFAQRGGIERVIEAERQKELDTVENWRKDFWNWYERMRKTDEKLHPHCRLIAVFAG